MANLTVTCSLGTVAGPVRVEAEESAARVATVTIVGGGSPDTYLGQAVTISYGGTQIFSGKVNKPQYDGTTGLLTLSCSDLLQETFEAMTEAQILAAITGGRWSQQVFGDREDGWQQALDVLSTVPSEVHLNGAGSLVVTSWAAGGGTAFADADVVTGSVRADFAARRDMINEVTISAQVRFTRRHHREHIFGWTYEHTSFCDWFAATHTLPTREMIQSAAEGAVWLIQAGKISFGALPDSGVYSCGAWSISDEEQRSLAVSAGWTAVRRWSQTVTETYTITVRGSGSVARYGTLLQEDGGSYLEEYSDESWDQDKGTETPSGGAWTTNVLGDYYSDEITRADADDTIETLIAIASTRIKATHRRNFVSFDIPLNTGVDIGTSASVGVTGAASASGKVYQIVHNINPQEGAARATTTIKLACSRGGGGADDIITAPAAPDTQPVHAAPSASTTLQTRIGGEVGAPPYDADWTGYTGNASIIAGGTETYPNRFRIVTPDIEDESRDEVTGASTGTVIAVGVPDDTLTVVAPT